MHLRVSLKAFFFIVLITYALKSEAQTSTVKNPPFLRPLFKAGEELHYIIRYGFIRAGEASVKVIMADQLYKGKKAIHFSAVGQTAGSFNVFYKVRNRYDSFIDSKTFLPFTYTEDIRENKYTRNGEANFDYSKKQVFTTTGTYSIGEHTRDIVSAFYFARSLDLEDVRPGDKFIINYFLEGGVASLVVSYLGKETITTDLGTFNCLKYSPSLQPGRIFRKDSKMYLWITADDNRVPIRARAEILVGAITMDLKSYTNLNSPLKTN